MKLHGHEPWVIGQLHGLDQLAVRRKTGKPHTALLEDRAVFVIELVAVAMALGYLWFFISGPRKTAFGQAARLRAQPHSAAHFHNAPLRVHQTNDRVRGVRVKFGAVGVLQAAHVARKLDCSALHAKADSEKRDLVFARIARRDDLALDSAHSEPARNQDAVHTVEQFLRVAFFEVFGFDFLFDDPHVIGNAAVRQRLIDGFIRGIKMDILADHGDGDLALRALENPEHLFPCIYSRAVTAQFELFQNQFIEAFAHQHQRQFIDCATAFEVNLLDHGATLDIAEERNLVAHLIGQRFFRAADKNVRQNAELAKLAHGVLRRLGLDFPDHPEVRNQREMHEQRVAVADFLSELANGFKKRQTLDVADSAADLGDHHVHAGRRQGAHRILDLVGDMRHYLNRAAEEITVAFLGDDRPVNLAGGVITVTRGACAGEAFVVTEVKVGLCPVISNIDLAVLEGAHGARIYIYVRIEFLHRNSKTVTFQEEADGCRG